MHLQSLASLELVSTALSWSQILWKCLLALQQLALQDTDGRRMGKNLNNKKLNSFF